MKVPENLSYREIGVYLAAVAKVMCTHDISVYDATDEDHYFDEMAELMFDAEIEEHRAYELLEFLKPDFAIAFTEGV